MRGASITSLPTSARTVVLLATNFPGDSEAKMRALVRRHMQDAIGGEWPAMARQQTTLAMITA